MRRLISNKSSRDRSDRICSKCGTLSYRNKCGSRAQSVSCTQKAAPGEISWARFSMKGENGKSMKGGPSTTSRGLGCHGRSQRSSSVSFVSALWIHRQSFGQSFPASKSRPPGTHVSFNIEYSAVTDEISETMALIDDISAWWSPLNLTRFNLPKSERFNPNVGHFNHFDTNSQCVVQLGVHHF